MYKNNNQRNVTWKKTSVWEIIDITRDNRFWTDMIRSYKGLLSTHVSEMIGTDRHLYYRWLAAHEREATWRERYDNQQDMEWHIAIFTTQLKPHRERSSSKDPPDFIANALFSVLAIFVSIMFLFILSIETLSQSNVLSCECMFSSHIFSPLFKSL